MQVPLVGVDPAGKAHRRVESKSEDRPEDETRLRGRQPTFFQKGNPWKTRTRHWRMLFPMPTGQRSITFPASSAGIR